MMRVLVDELHKIVRVFATAEEHVIVGLEQEKAVIKKPTVKAYKWVYRGQDGTLKISQVHYRDGTEKLELRNPVQRIDTEFIDIEWTTD